MNSGNVIFFFSSCMSFFRTRFEYDVFHVFFLQQVFFYMMINNFSKYIVAVGVY